MTSPLQTRIARLTLHAVLIVSLACLSRAQDVNWGTTGNDLNSGLIPGTTAPGGVRFSNVDGEGFDIVVTTLNLTGEGMGAFGCPSNALGSFGNSFWFQGPNSGSSIPTASVEFQFFQMGTNTPVAVTGVDFSFQDAEVNERFYDFGYYDQTGNLQLLSASDSDVFSGDGGIAQNLAPYVIQNDSPYAGGTQMGKGLYVDLASTPITGLVFDPYRSVSNGSDAGSVEMTGLGNLEAVPEASSALFGIALLGTIAAARWRSLPWTARQS